MRTARDGKDDNEGEVLLSEWHVRKRVRKKIRLSDSMATVIYKLIATSGERVDRRNGGCA